MKLGFRPDSPASLTFDSASRRRVRLHLDDLDGENGDGGDVNDDDDDGGEEITTITYNTSLPLQRPTMSDQEEDQPRRSGRERRRPQAYGNSPSKNNRMEVDDDRELHKEFTQPVHLVHQREGIRMTDEDEDVEDDDLESETSQAESEEVSLGRLLAESSLTSRSISDNLVDHKLL
jgi:hypothetical protein